MVGQAYEIISPDKIKWSDLEDEGKTEKYFRVTINCTKEDYDTIRDEIIAYGMIVNEEVGDI